jgi:hypothetical protein
MGYTWTVAGVAELEARIGKPVRSACDGTVDHEGLAGHYGQTRWMTSLRPRTQVGSSSPQSDAEATGVTTSKAI